MQYAADTNEMAKSFPVTFLPFERTVRANPGENLLDVARRAGLSLNADCNGSGVCGRCRLILREGQIEPGVISLLPEEDLKEGYFLACTATASSDLTVEVPASSIPAGVLCSEKLLEKIFQAELPYRIGPLVEKVYLELPPPDKNGGITLLDTLYRSLAERTGIPSFVHSFSLMQQLPELMKQSEGKVTVALCRHREPAFILGLEKGDESNTNYGVVIDIGTTTVEGILTDISTGKVLKMVSQINPQVKYGADVTARLHFASRGKGLLILNDILNDRINEILMELIVETGISKDHVYSVVLSGNTAMMHFFLGLDTELLRKSPHIPFALSFPLFHARELNIYTNPEAQVHIVPGVGSYAGGDLISSLVATGMPGEDFLLVDIGTNGEVAVVSENSVVCAATSAGPAFEGGNIKHGMRASSGAVNRVYYSLTHRDFEWETIDNNLPGGICGTGLVDALAELFLHGFVDRRGRFRKREKSDRFRIVDDVCEFVLIPQDRDTPEIALSETDIDYMIRSKGALFTGYDYLLQLINKKPDDLKRFYIAGALGGMINIENGITIGLFPDIDRKKFHFIGNGSLLGGWMMLLSGEARRRAAEIASGAAYVELSDEPGYMNEYTSSLFLPHTDLNRFPSIAGKLEVRG